MTGIQWTDKTWNPVVGCTPVSPGCLNCYAAKDAVRLEAIGVKQYQPRQERETDGRGEIENRKTIRIVEKRAGRAVFTGDVRLVPERLTEPLKWRKPAMCFLGSIADVFHESVPFDYIDQIMAVIALCPGTIFQLVTKRPERMAEYFNRAELTQPKGPWWRATVKLNQQLTMRVNTSNWNSTGHGATVPLWPLPNLWLGTSVEDQKAADERIPHLLNCPAAVRFLSAEPLLEPVILRPTNGPIGLTRLARRLNGDVCNGIDWVIVGGESGAQARPCEVEWIRSVVNQCKASGVPVFVKQLGAAFCDARNGIAGAGLDIPPEGMGLLLYRLQDRKGGNMAEWPEDLRVREWPAIGAMGVKHGV